ncbi:coiled-coil domain-containing protein 60 isoform X1 [Rhineura floridana]|uniref:coiled-coil domain-containing protein 60 isoform X1 n=1 Tax=Rhineura floridana TaxID=261503 RepID=UPI002AC851C4|nr:coiled-coil domain-containing protein 60 isoform X1 [Rhineura floridana]
MPMHPKSDPRYFVVIRPLPIPNQKGLKVQARSNTIYNCWDVTREQVFRENYHRRIKQLTQQGYFTPSWKPYQDFGEPLYLDPRKLTLYGLGQLPLEFFREDVCPEEITEPAEPKAAKKSKQKDHEKKPLPFRHLEKDLRTLHRDLVHTRCLINSVKIGRGYFHTLHRETLERKNALMLEERKEEERWKTEFQPPRYPSSSSSDEGSSDDEELTDFFLTECPFLRETEKKKKKKIVRPFTPVYNGLLAEKHPDAHFESIFRQLCALNWLLEALTLEPNSSMKPVITCWNPKDYGGGKSSLKVITKEKTVKTRWEHFLLQTKGRKYTQKAQYRTAASKKTPKRSSTMSISSPHSKTTLTSTSSLTPVSDEAAQPPSDSAKEVEEMESSYSKQTKEEEEQPMSYYLQTLLQMIHEDVAKNFSKENMFWNSKYPRSHTMLTRRDLESDLSFGQKGKSSASSSKDDKTSMGAMREETPGEQRPKSSLAVTLREDKTVTATYSDEDSTEQSSRPQSSFIKRKEQLYNEMKEVFHEVAHESAFRLHDQLDILERRREEKSIQKYLCLRRITKFRRDLERMRQSIRSIEPAQDAESENWFSTLLARIPDDIKRDHRTQKVLKKLERFARNPDLRIRPPTFLKVLGELRIWEICSPDICAAVEDFSCTTHHTFPLTSFVVPARIYCGDARGGLQTVVAVSSTNP